MMFFVGCGVKEYFFICCSDNFVYCLFGMDGVCFEFLYYCIYDICDYGVLILGGWDLFISWLFY